MRSKIITPDSSACGDCRSSAVYRLHRPRGRDAFSSTLQSVGADLARSVQHSGVSHPGRGRCALGDVLISDISCLRKPRLPCA